MANQTITQLPSAGPITGTELIPLVQNGQTVKATVQAINSSPSLTQTFLTVNQEPTLTNSQYLSGGSGVGLVSGGAQSYLRIVLNGASGSLEGIGNGIVAKTATNAVTARTLTASGAGLGITNGDGVAGNPTFALTGVAAAVANLGGTGIMAIQNGATVGGVRILGTTNQISVANGNGVGNPTIAIADNVVLPGTASMTVPSGTTAQQPVGGPGQMRYDTTLETFVGYTAGAWRAFSLAGGVTEIDTGTGLLGGPITSVGTISIDTSVVATLSGSQTLTNKTINAANNTLTNIGNSSLTNSSITINGSTVNLGGSITVTATASSALTIGAGLSGTSYNGSAPVTIAIDSTVATLTGSQTLTNKTISGSSNTLTNIGNTSLTNSSTTFNGVTVALGASGTITAVNPYALTIGTGLSGTSYDGAGAVTVAIASTGVTAASYGSASNTLTATVNAQGQLTALAQTPIAISYTQVSGLGTAATLNAGVANGVATLDGSGTIPLSQIPASLQGALNYQGTWNASTNTPTLTSSVGTKGFYYVVSVAGTTNLNGVTDWQIGDWAVFNGSVWQKIDNTDLVTSVNGYTGTVVLGYADVGAPSTTGTNATGTWSISINGNAATVTNGVYTTGSYSNPTWITSLAASKLSGTVAVANGGTGLASYTVGDMLWASGATTISGLAIGTSGYVMTSSGAAPQWSAQSSLSVGTATNLAGGTAGALPYQTGAGATSFLSLGTTNYVLTAGASAPQYVAQSTLSVGSATNATNTAITANSTNADYYLTFVSATTGNLPQLVNSSLTLNPSTGKLTNGIAGGAF